MNILGLIEEIDKADPEFQDRISPRRDAIKNITSFGSKVAVAALPFVFSTLMKKAYGQVLTTTIIGTLNFALKLEFLESAFYTAGINNSTLKAQFSATELSYLTEIAGHEASHVAFLQGVLGTNAILQSTQGKAGTYDFTGGFSTSKGVTGTGPFPNVMTNSTTFLTVAIAFEDTGVRAYKGDMFTLWGSGPYYLSPALDIHSVEARHASAIRQLLYNRYVASASTGINIKPWITGANDTGITGLAANYTGEDNTIQNIIDVSQLPGASGLTPLTAAQECFDEPLTQAAALLLVNPFGVI